MSVRFSAVDCPVKESMSIVGAIHESPVKSEPPNGEAHFVGANCVFACGQRARAVPTVRRTTHQSCRGASRSARGMGNAHSLRANRISAVQNLRNNTEVVPYIVGADALIRPRERKNGGSKPPPYTRRGASRSARKIRTTQRRSATFVGAGFHARPSTVGFYETLTVNCNP